MKKITLNFNIHRFFCYGTRNKINTKNLSHSIFLFDGHTFCTLFYARYAYRYIWIKMWADSAGFYEYCQKNPFELKKNCLLRNASVQEMYTYIDQRWCDDDGKRWIGWVGLMWNCVENVQSFLTDLSHSRSGSWLSSNFFHSVYLS